MATRSPGLNRGLDEDVQRALDLDDLAGVLKGGRPLGLDDAADDPVGDVGEAEEEELAEHVQPAVREEP